MNLLAIDTATEACSAALCLDGDIISRYRYAPRQHAELILPMVDGLLSEAGIKLQQLDCLAFGRGPGAFTGVRIATGVIQGLAFATDLPVVPVSTLATLAQGVIDKSDYMLSAIDARMGEIYWGLFQVRNKIVAGISDESVDKPGQVSVPADKSWFGVGSGWKTYKEILVKTTNPSGTDDDAYPDARNIIPLAIHDFSHGRAVPAEKALPVYLRNHVADRSSHNPGFTAKR